VIPGLPPLKVLETITLDADATSLRLPASGNIADHANFPSGSRHVVILFNAKHASVSSDTIDTTFNDDTGSNYNVQVLNGEGSNATAYRQSGEARIQGSTIPGTSPHESAFGGGYMLIPHAFNDYGHKATLAVSGQAEDRIRVTAGRWADTSALTHITLTSNSGGDGFEEDSVFKLCVVDEDYAISGVEQILTSDGTMDTVTLPDVAGNVSFIGYIRGKRATNADHWNMHLNGDTTATNYAHQTLQADGSGVHDWNVHSGSSGVLGLETLYQPAEGADANVFGPVLGTIQQHALDATGYQNFTHIFTFNGWHANSSASNMRIYSKVWRSTAAVTSVYIFPNPVDYGSATAASGTMLSFYSSIPKVLIDRQSLDDAAASVTFTFSGLTIPSNVKDLRINYYTRSDDEADKSELLVEFNGDTTASNYERQGIQGTTTDPGAFQDSNAIVGAMPAADQTANFFGGGTVLIPEYAKDDRHKHRLGWSGITGNDDTRVQMFSTRWKNTDAITSIVLKNSTGDNFIAGSVFELEGIGDLAGWQGTVMGVENPGKVMGVEAANIEKVMGVA